LRRLWRRAPRDVALTAALMWAGMFRFSDLKDVCMKDVSMKDGEVEVVLRKTKTTAFGGPPRGVVCVVPKRVVRSLRKERDNPEQKLVRISYRSFVKGVQVWCPKLTAHSFRRGAVRAAMRHGVADEAVMRVTGHKSLESLATYADLLPAGWRQQMVMASAATLW